ncbi:MAG: RHH-type proline utilization regulon transcriptional repressor/proline dehydrogenase [Arenicella sp.]|jgi:RHH-type proline utilization regulon transcriptional repressor/proline dehydrogenase/delta 1-pyrroline-5-carboxylate dehydrogenase
MNKPKSTSLPNIRGQLRTQIHADENLCVEALLVVCDESPWLTQTMRDQARQRATEFVENCRAQGSRHNILDAFLQEFSLSNQEGIALMCLAEALLRIPDKDTADALINEKILAGDWGKHFRKSDSNLVNMATVGLILTGGFVRLEENFSGNPSSWLPAISKKVGEPVVRKAIRQAMGIMGGQYVLGRSIDEAARIGRKDNSETTRFSFDMLGEGARTHKDAHKYYDAYLAAIHSIGKMIDNGVADSVIEADGISVKLSALHPRYHYSHHHTVMTELLPLLKELAITARGFNIGFTIDAEESERLDISLDLFEALVRDPDLDDWDGLGLVVQAYQKRAPLVIQWLATLARENSRRLMVRLVKGAYWDREVKFAQEMGYSDYPVYTRKVNTDLSYQVCAELLLDASDVIFPQFATHNAHTVAVVWGMIEARKNASSEKTFSPFEFQRLHGMGDLLYGEVKASTAQSALPMRVYAPVGAHKDLLPYLVRRLLENGANSSFVSQFLDKDTPVSEIVSDPVKQVASAEVYRHDGIPIPINIYRNHAGDASQRDNSAGLDLDNPLVVEQLLEQMSKVPEVNNAASIVNGEIRNSGAGVTIVNPAKSDVCVGTCVDATDQDIEDALSGAAKSQPAWDKLGGAERSRILQKVADLLEQDHPRLMRLITLEAGRIFQDTISEVREAVDFCRYYGLQAAQHFNQATQLPGPTGEQNLLSLHGRGVFLCISPWNFPLAIFVGQISAALAAGNSVIAKPAEQTPIVAFEAIKLFHQAGVPKDVLQLLMGKGSEIGPKLVTDLRLSGVCFTGSTGVAKLINCQLAERDGPIVPLIAETGGQNAMIVDSSALPEQVVDDAINSAFNSAGQRCSALRVLFLQEEIADGVIEMLIGAMDALHLGDPALLSTDVGPVIDKGAYASLQAHVASMQANDGARVLARFDSARVPQSGAFFAPTLIEIENLNVLKEEVFGAVIHVLRYKSKHLHKVLDDINNTGFGLTLGVHSRREEFANTIFEHTHCGNTYINRNVVGAVVGVQPFGGQGLSGTGPKAGGPHYLYRFATEKTKTTNLVATGGDVSLLNLE